ncbi:RNA polymerase sigma factor RpoD/SigA [Vitiosangium sp. GDMCC 1.1324]|uniref:sigma-70 family RNA polymerase sigma factor n=1 Tax=Vitiosangium sp. (strain GDMCC 1.1324) TaxID=2138576 RepID=UPI00130E6706|nr:sigma-70 family RNA polymerase sigma factor [Vitiosangium sp. GDMCC 1.1324]
MLSARHFRPARLARSPKSRRFSLEALTPGDRALFETWLAEVRRHPLLSREEEAALARQLRECGDPKARARLVASNLRLVVKLAREHHRPPLLLMDLIQEGNLGLLLAVERFEPERGVRLCTYAAWWIRAYLLRFIIENWRVVKLGTTDVQRKLFFRMREEEGRLLASGQEATPRLLASRLGVPEEEVVEMDQRLRQDEVRLDVPPDDERGRPFQARALHSGTPAVDEELGQRELTRWFLEKAHKFARGLHDERERYILEHRLLAEEPETLQTIGKHFQVSRERARQVEAGLIASMREYLLKRMPDFTWLDEEPGLHAPA